MGNSMNSGRRLRANESRLALLAQARRDHNASVAAVRSWHGTLPATAAERRALLDRLLDENTGEITAIVCGFRAWSDADVESCLSDLGVLGALGGGSALAERSSREGVSALQLRMMFSGADGEADVDAMAEHCGATVIYDRLSSCDARVLGYHRRAIIRVNVASPRCDPRFAAGHELSHWLTERGQVHTAPQIPGDA